MRRLRRLYLLTGLIGLIVFVLPELIGVAFGGGDAGLLYLTYFWVLLWLLLGGVFLVAGLLTRGATIIRRRFANLS